MNRAPSSAAELGRRTPNTPRPSGVPSTSPTGCNPPAAVTADNRALWGTRLAGTAAAAHRPRESPRSHAVAADPGDRGL